MRIFYGKRTGRGISVSVYGGRRAVRSHRKSGGYVPLLLSPGLGVTGGSVSGARASGTGLAPPKEHMNDVIRKLSKLQLKGPKKNIVFQV